MDVDFFKKIFQFNWDADYQFHVHVNGDAGLQMVLDTLAENMQWNPREDHRAVVVHCAVSTPGQVKRIKQLGAIASANSYYPVSLAEQ
jgi:predicted amidohydrolase YtcJ